MDSTTLSSKRSSGSSSKSSSNKYNPHLLRLALRGNAVFSGLVAIDLLLFYQEIAALMGIFDPKYLVWLGMALIGFVIMLLSVTERKPISLSMAKFIVLLDVGWVIGSILLMIFDAHWFTAAGHIAIAAVASVVTLFATYQYIGIKRFSQNDAQYS